MKRSMYYSSGYYPPLIGRIKKRLRLFSAVADTYLNILRYIFWTTQQVRSSPLCGWTPGLVHASQSLDTR